MNDIKQRLERVLEGKASEDEREALLKLFNEGKLDDIIDGETREFLSDESAFGMDPQRITEMIQYITSHEEANVFSINRYKWRMAWVAAAMLLITTALGLWFYRDRLASKESLIGKNEYTVSGRNYVSLPDGSTVLLSEGSYITYSASFGKTDRIVNFTGKGYFDVIHNATKPFIVLTNDVKTTVLGTAFNIDTQSDQEKVIVTVTRGKVTVNAKDRDYGILLPDEQLTINTDNYLAEKKSVDIADVTAWQSNYLVFNNVTMKQAAELISEQFHVKVIISNEQIKNCKVSGGFLNNENLEEIMTLITGLRQATYTVHNNEVIIEGGTGCQDEAR